ncbi:hypothetical protein TRFO_17226 [Tritrichomonas foetus]|uniref:Uncharacterized protein n=1 Tax=Tritrichomonas foetus TaxID=1144522 RepID=A0A1J4KSY9_9EUKA|nr:hypothetical protein TRFO_17226 [Tritrichomonas foetus]|eukprot:OHT12774.1 hypothetical protein TRFO_17226 [Tritrichomonas foetus]
MKSQSSFRHLSIKYDDKYGVPNCYVKFFENDENTKKKLKMSESGKNGILLRLANPNKIQITVKQRTKRKFTTKTQFLHHFLSRTQVETIVKHFKTKGLSCTYNSEQTLVINGDSGEEFRSYLVNEYKIQNNEISLIRKPLKDSNKNDEDKADEKKKIEYPKNLDNYPSEVMTVIELENNFDVNPLLKLEEMVYMWQYEESSSYFYDNGLLILDEWDIAKEHKERLTIENMPLDFQKTSIIHKFRQEFQCWETTFPAANKIDPEESESVSNEYISLFDTVHVSWSDTNEQKHDNNYKETKRKKKEKKNEITGKVIKLHNGDVTATFSCPVKFKPPDYFDINEDSIEKSPQQIGYTLSFEPNDVIFKRRAIGLLELYKLKKSHPIRKIILTPEISLSTQEKHHEFKIEDAGFDFSSSSIKTEDRSKLVFNATKNQTKAVNLALKNVVSLIQGPPGCGKTVTIASIAINLLRNPRLKGRIMICGHSNQSVENIIRVLAPPCRAFGKNIVWAASAARDIKSLTKYISEEQKSLLHYKSLNRETKESMQLKYLTEKMWDNGANYEERKKIDELRDQIYLNIIQESDIVCCTLESAAKKCLNTFYFKTVIVDESTQSIESSMLIPLIHGATKLVLVGDQKQLSPVIEGPLVGRKYTESLFNRLIKQNKSNLNNNSSSESIMLTTQYRMHPAICHFPNVIFYEGKIINGVTEADRLSVFNIPDKRNKNGEKCIPIPMPLYFVQVDGQEEKENTSFYNEDEAIQVYSLVDKLLHNGIEGKDIGVISFYGAQVRLIRKKLEKLRFANMKQLRNLKIASVDSFQGSERDYIIISCARANSSGNIGFLTDQRRLNVAITRPRRGLIIVGHSQTLSSNEIWNKYLDFIGSYQNDLHCGGNIKSGSNDSTIPENINIVTRNQKQHNVNFQQLNEEDEGDFQKELFHEKPGFNISKVTSTISGGDMMILWPDVKSHIQFLQKWTNDLLEKLNHGKHITIAYDSENVCIQLGEVYNENFDIFNSFNHRNNNSAFNSKQSTKQTTKSQTFIPPIGKKTGVIIFFYERETSEENNKLISIVKPLFEHQNISILTFDFTSDLWLLDKYGIQVNTERLIDSQLININTDDDLILYKNVLGLKRFIEQLTNQDPFTTKAIEEVSDNFEKDFPFSANRLLIKLHEMPIISTVTETFLNYSANDIILTALAFNEVLHKKKLHQVHKMTKKKLVDFYSAKEKYGSPVAFREYSFLRKHFTGAMTKKLYGYNTIVSLLGDWDNMTRILKIWNEGNRSLKMLMRIDGNKLENRIVSMEKALMMDRDLYQNLISLGKVAKPPHFEMFTFKHSSQTFYKMKHDI